VLIVAPVTVATRMRKRSPRPQGRVRRRGNRVDSGQHMDIDAVSAVFDD
jgi:hypothetical protein